MPPPAFRCVSNSDNISRLEIKFFFDSSRVIVKSLHYFKQNILSIKKRRHKKSFITDHKREWCRHSAVVAFVISQAQQYLVIHLGEHHFRFCGHLHPIFHSTSYNINGWKFSHFLRLFGIFSGIRIRVWDKLVTYWTALAWTRECMRDDNTFWHVTRERYLLTKISRTLVQIPSEIVVLRWPDAMQ